MSVPSSPQPSSPQPSRRRYLSLWLRRLATDRLARGRSPAPDEPVVVIQAVKSAQRIVAMNDAAQRLGLRLGMPLADARAMYPALAHPGLVAAGDETADRRLLDAVADWCDRYTPLIGLDAPDGLMLDITGCAHLFGGETAMGRDLLARLAREGLHARAAVADTAGCAWAVAHYGDASLVPPQRMRVALAPLPAAALRLAPETVEALAELGLRQVGDLIDLPRAPLAARFGEILVRRLDQALGRLDEPITPRLPLPSYVAEQRFADPIGLERDVLGTIARLAAQLSAAMERRQDGARLLQAVLFRTDNKVYRIEVGTGAPLREASRIVRLFADRLAAIGEACDPGFGFDMVRLAALVTERSEPVQAALAHTGRAAPGEDAELWHLIDRLGARFGPRRVTRLVPQDTHIPEFAVAALPAAARRTNAQQQSASSVLFSPVLEDEAQDRTRDSIGPARPIRLFERPEPVEAIAEVPDGPPARFRWRRVLHVVAIAEGPERIAMEWWRDETGQALTRDYFRVESSDGLRAWLYREGLFGRETPQPRWFLHGLFG
jgi:protein ImuB